jgi:alkylation response protein AidB-like acyl-CoA dehydrogenase
VDIDYPAEAEDFRREIREILAAELPPGFAGLGSIKDLAEAKAFVAHWRTRLHAHGLLSIAWPTEYGGRGLTRLHQVVLMEELTRAGVPFGQPWDSPGIKMLGNTILRWGTDEQKARFLPAMLSGEEAWCQGFSEPGAGSDLAAVSTFAELRDGKWHINGQKIWTSFAYLADWIFVLARSDREAPRHRGITFLLVPIKQPGVEVRPIKHINGASEFCEVFFTDAVTDEANVIGPINGGWKVANTILGHERGEEAATNPILFRSELDRLLELARVQGVAEDPVFRDRLAWCYARVEVMRFLGYRILTQVLHEDGIGPAASISKLYWSEYHQVVTQLALDIQGLDGLAPVGRPPVRQFRTDDPGADPLSSGSWWHVSLLARAGTIYAGTSQVQRNILAESVLGLPREPRG